MEVNVLDFINKLETYKIAMKNMHWDSSSMSEHKLWDDILSYVTEQQDEIAEVAQGVLGTIKRNELKPEHYEITNSKKALNDIIKDAKSFHASISDKKFIGLRSVIESFLAEMDKFVYLMDFCLKEDVSLRLNNKNQIKENMIKKNQIKLTEAELHMMVREAVNRVIMENQIKSSQQIADIVHQIKAFEDSGNIIFTSPHPSSTEMEARKYITQARLLLSQAAFALRSLGY